MRSSANSRIVCALHLFVPQRAEATGARLEEAKGINSSLYALTRCIDAITQRVSHVVETTSVEGHAAAAAAVVLLV
jgi:hypothetical protein